MKKITTILLVVCMVAMLLAGCAQPSEQQATDASPAATESAAGEESPAPAEDSSAPAEESPAAAGADLSETGTLKLAWIAGIGTDTMFESPFHDIKSLYPQMLFSTLVKIQSDGTYRNELATDYTVSDDGTVYTFTINPDATFTDGTPVTAEDVAFTLDVSIAFEKSWIKNFLKSIKGTAAVSDGSAETLEGVNVIDEKTIEITLDQADNTLLYGLTLVNVIPKHAFEGVALNDVPTYEEYWSKPFGSGAYVIDQVSFPNYFTMVRSDSFYGAPAGIKNVLYTSYDTGGNEAVVAATVAGELDFIFGDAVNDSVTMGNITTQNPDVTGVMIPSSYTRQIRFNLTGSTDDKYNAAVQDPKVREAFSLILDKDTIASFYGDQAVAAMTMINPDDPLYNTDIPLYQRDVEKAKQLLDEAGFDYSKPIRFLYYYDDQTTADIMEVMKQNFADAGVTLEPFLATGDLTGIIYDQKNWDMNYSGGGSLGDPVFGYQYIVPDGANWDMLYGNVDERQATYGKYYSEYVGAQDEATKKAAADALQLQEVTDNFDINVYNLNKIVGYNSAHLEFDTSILDADYQQQKDYKFDTWKLIGE